MPKEAPKAKLQSVKTKKPAKTATLAAEKKVSIKSVKAETVKEPVEKKVAGKLSIPVYALSGEQAGSLSLPEELFGVKVNKALLSQAVRVYFNNVKGHFSNSKTRSEVQGSTKKVQAQKGTGHARHGSVRAPIYVGGGIALGPKARKSVLELPQKMKKAALSSALTAKYQAGEVIGAEGLEKASGKTKQLASWLAKTGAPGGLLIIGEKNEKLERAVRNLPNLKTMATTQLNAFEVVSARMLMVTKEAVEKLARTGKKEKE